MLRNDLRIDVTDSIPLPGPLQVAVNVYLPDPASLAEKPVVMFASPGGGYTRWYFDLHFAGHEGYSQAEYHTTRGMIYVAYDHLGVGDSSTHQINEMTMEMMADANTAMVKEVLKRLSDDTLQEGFPAIKDPFVVGTGQSLGAGTTIVMQGRNKCFDAVGILGVSAIHTKLPQPTFKAFRQGVDIFQFTRSTPLDQLSVPRTAAHVPDFIYPFHWEDVPPDILDADMKGGYAPRKTAPNFGSMTVPPCAVACNSPGYFTPEASMIEVPVFIAVGERDVCPNPWAEPSAFWRSNDVSVYVVPTMAHMHNFASSREKLWRRLDQWTHMIAADN